MAGNSQSPRTTPVLHVIPVGTSLLDKEDFKATVSRKTVVADLPRIKDTLAQLEDQHRGLRGTDRHPIKAFENMTLESAIETLSREFNITPGLLGDLKLAYEVLRHLDPKVELEKRLYPGSTKKDRLPAELSSLYLFYGQMEQKDGGKGEFKLPTPSIKDDVFLLATDTMEGAFCACCLRNYLLENNAPSPLIRPFIGEVRLSIVGGLQVEDADMFRAKGVDHLKEVRDSAIVWANEKEVYLNITGGYKGVLPVITVLGLARNWHVYYAYEESPARIDIEVPGVTFGKLMIRSASQRGIHEKSIGA